MRAACMWLCLRAAQAITLLLLVLAPTVGVMAGDSANGADKVATQASVKEGKRLFLAVGCYECHGTTGTGANTGPRLAPNPIPMRAFVYQLRHPLGAPPYGNMKMPPYAATVLSDAQVNEIYAYLKSIKPGPAAAQIPLLNH